MPNPPPRDRIADFVSSTTAAKDSLLDAAERRFARQGFAATTIKDIAAEAQVNSALLYYYFANKEDLYHAVLRRRITGLAADVGPALMAPVPPAEAIRRFVQAYVGFLLLHPDLPTLMQREVLDHAASHALPEIQAGAGALFHRFAAIIRAGQESGDFRRDVDPVDAVVSIMGQVVYAFMAQPIIQGVLLQRGTTGPDAVWLREFGVHAAEFSLRALAPDAAPPRKKAS
jgi:AcrR family transcriptional regulator